METIKNKKDVEKITGLERQKAYLKRLEESGASNDSFFITDKVMESMRDNGYRDIRRAVDDLLDNSEQAGAKNIAVVTTSDREDKKNAREKIQHIAIIDDGEGMYPKMLLQAVKWGGTDRHGMRDGLGRFGFGLPTAAISVTRTYEVYSKVKGGKWHKVVIDLNQIAKIAMTTGGNIAFTPKVEETALPEIAKNYIKKQWSKNDLEQGTVVLLLNADRIRSFSLPAIFQVKMLHNIGLTYRHFIPEINFYVNDKKVEMIDPLFLNPNCIGYDEGNGHLAEGIEEFIIPIKNPLSDRPDIQGNIRFRPSFRDEKFQKDNEGKLIKKRWNVMKENKGYFIVCRAGRQIDVVKESNYQSDHDNITILTYDTNWSIELDFDPTLDELFGITTNKQQVEIDGYLWDIFKSQGIPQMIAGFRKRIKNIKEIRKAREENQQDSLRESEQIMEDAKKIDNKQEIPKEKMDKAQKKIDEEAENIAKKEKVPIEVAKQQLEAETEGRKYKVVLTHLPGAPFYDIEVWGTQIRLKINSAHRFYADIYSQQNTRGKTALELLLFVIGQSELESQGEKNLFYGNERFEWSKMLELRLKMLDQKDPIIDKQTFEEEEHLS